MSRTPESSRTPDGNAAPDNSRTPGGHTDTVPPGGAPAATYETILLDALARDPDRTAVITADGTSVTAGQLRALAYRMAAELADRGIGRGTTVALLSGNRHEVLAARYAANLLGARVVFLYQGLAPEAQATLIESVAAALLIVDSDLADTAHAVLHHLAHHGDASSAPAAPSAPDAAVAQPSAPASGRPLPAVLTLGPTPVRPTPADGSPMDASPGAHPLGDDLLAAASPSDPRSSVVPERPGAALPGDDWCIRHTGGTTGIPKGVRMAHASYAWLITRPMADAGDPPRFLAATSLAHLAGILADVTLVAGGTVVLHRTFDPGAVLAAIARHRISHTWLLPPLLYQLLDHPDLRTTDLTSLTRISYGGCVASPTRLRQALREFGPVLYGSYGQSEAMGISEATPEDHLVAGPDGRITAGRPVPGVELAIRDAAGRTLGPRERGEIHVRSAGVMNGYWRQPERTAEVLTEDGWVRTGDVGFLDTDGRLYLVDRLKDVIIVVGGHVHPAEVEDLLHSHPAVAHCAVYGVRTADASEEVHAAVVPAPGHRVDPAALREFVTRRKGAMYAPVAVHAYDAIPLTPAGKPDKNRLRAASAPLPTAVK